VHRHEGVSRNFWTPCYDREQQVPKSSFLSLGAVVSFPVVLYLSRCLLFMLSVSHYFLMTDLKEQYICVEICLSLRQNCIKVNELLKGQCHSSVEDNAHSGNPWTGYADENGDRVAPFYFLFFLKNEITATRASFPGCTRNSQRNAEVIPKGYFGPYQKCWVHCINLDGVNINNSNKGRHIVWCCRLGLEYFAYAFV
jgi:hypothetical protein